MRASHRRFLIFAALGLTVIAAIYAPEPQEGDVVAAAPARASNSRVAPRLNTDAKEGESILAIRPRDFELLERPVFVSRSWVEIGAVKPQPTVPEVVQYTPPPEPVASPNFVVLGKMEEQGIKAVFLQAADSTIVAREGQRVDQNFKVASIDDDGVKLVHLRSEQEFVLGPGVSP